MTCGTGVGAAGVALADCLEPGVEIRDRRVVRVEEAPLGEERVRERLADRAFDGLPELRARHQEGMDVHAVRIQSDPRTAAGAGIGLRSGRRSDARPCHAFSLLHIVAALKVKL